MLAFVFQGQGTQRRGMGGRLFDQVPEFRRIEPQIDAALGYSVRELCLENPEERLTQTQYAQPALFVTRALHHYKAMAEGARPHFFAGHSLGEYNALLAAGVFDLLTGVRLVQWRSDLMSRIVNGSMSVVIGLTREKLESVLAESGFDRIDPCSFNSPTQTVIAGPVEDLQNAQPVLQKAGAVAVIPLQVSSAFHSRYMEEAAGTFRDFLLQFELSAPRTPVFANVTAEEYPSDKAAIQDLLLKHMTHPVRWVECVHAMAARGVTTFREIGPGTILTRLIQEMQPDLARYSTRADAVPA